MAGQRGKARNWQERWHWRSLLVLEVDVPQTILLVAGALDVHFAILEDEELSGGEERLVTAVTKLTDGKENLVFEFGKDVANSGRERQMWKVKEPSMRCLYFGIVGQGDGNAVGNGRDVHT